MWAAITFFVSLVLMIAYVLFRMEEEKRGVKVWAHAREEADQHVLHAYRTAVMGDIPHHFRTEFLKLGHAISHAIVVLAVQVLRAIERPLSRLSHQMRRNAPVGNGKEPSQFLKTITPDKKKEDGTTIEGQ